jgi:hypothetical protein
MSRHTPGPMKAAKITVDRKQWAKTLSQNEIDVVLKGGSVIAAVWCAEDREGEEAANTRLFAAAPDMLAALEGIANTIGALKSLNMPRDSFDKLLEILDTARAAIAKARGES